MTTFARTWLVTWLCSCSRSIRPRKRCLSKTTVFSDDIKDRQVKIQDIGAEQVGTYEIRDGNVTDREIGTA